jgi:hypothetical protein
MQTQWDWTPYLTGGATRPDAMTNLDPAFASSLAAMFQNAPPEIRDNLRVMSAYRDVERQRQLWEEALAKYGDPEIADNWVAPPGRSFHNHGQAVDLSYLDPSATDWVHANAGQFGLHFPLSNENWHIEPIGARGGAAPAMTAPAAAGPNLTFGAGMPTMPTDSAGMAAMFQADPSMGFALGMPVGDRGQTRTAQADERRAQEEDRKAQQRFALASLIR